MRKIIISLVVLLMTTQIFAKVIKRAPVFVVSPTTGVFSGIRVGAGMANIYEDHAWETTLNYKNELCSHAKSHHGIAFEFMDSHHFDSIYLQANRFWNTNREKSFLILKGGIAYMPPFNFADIGDDPGWIMPVVTIGYGYSFKIKDKFYLRPSIDVGLQSNLINIGLAVTF